MIRVQGKVNIIIVIEPTEHPALVIILIIKTSKSTSLIVVIIKCSYRVLILLQDRSIFYNGLAGLLYA